MATRKVTITMPEDLLRKARAEVDAGRAATLSGYVSDVIAERVQHGRLDDVLEVILAQTGGEATESERAWARDVLAG